MALIIVMVGYLGKGLWRLVWWESHMPISNKTKDFPKGPATTC